MNVEFVDLHAQYEEIKSEIEAGLKKVLDKGNFILGEEVKQFEQAFAGYCGAKFGVGVNSGTDALFLSLVSLGIGPGDEVIVPAYTFIATALAVSYTGAKVVFADIDEQTYNLNPEKVKKAITQNTKAIIPVHLYGQPADMDEIMAIAREYKLRVIEDAAQCHGALYGNKRVGSIGDTGCFSFYPTKNLGAFGDGGLIVTSDEEIYKKLIILRDCGRIGRYEHVVKGYNSRLDTVQAVVLNVKLKHLDKWNAMRQKNSQLYHQLLKDVKGIILPFTKPNRNHIYHVYAIRIKNRDHIYEQLREKGIGVLIHYPIPLHLQKAYSELGYKQGDFPIAEKVATEIMSIPMSPHLSEEKLTFVAATLKELSDGK